MELIFVSSKSDVDRTGWGGIEDVQVGWAYWMEIAWMQWSQVGISDKAVLLNVPLDPNLECAKRIGWLESLHVV